MDTPSDLQTRRQQATQILALLQEVLPSVLAEYPVDMAYVYGSVVRGTVTPFSDVDIALVLSETPSSYQRLMLELEVQAAVEDASGLKRVDVRAINVAPLLVRGRIVQQGVLLYERERAQRVAFEVHTRKRYFDFAPAARRLRDAFLDKTRREGLLHG
ncbi:MAG: nucleotidyltransferase domain-containing protein [Anaerolineales bacterium]|nr:MAG: nucleotidyltransferase domain-containing protein [Anaerolineales bacterium]